jgi:hypothetical protein
MRCKGYRNGYKVTALSVVLLASLVRAGAQAPNPAMQPYVGHWAGEGWGWEERFRQSAGEFIQQFPGGKSLPPGHGADKTVMSLIVRHDTHFDFRVDEQGNITGEGEITYDLFPNLCGVAALTKQVNEQVNMMSKLTSIFEAAGAIGRETVSLEREEFFKEETELAEQIEHIEGTLKSLEKQGWPQKTNNPLADTLARELAMSESQSAEVQELVSAVIWKDCFDPHWRIAGTVPACLDMVVRPLAKESEAGEFFKGVLGLPIDLVYDQLKETSDKYFESLDEHSELEASACSGTGDALSAGLKVGPSDPKEIAQDLGPEAAKAALDMDMGGAPTGMMLSIPGITQVQYYYKGLTKGPESRNFKLKGHVVPAGKGAKIYLEMDGDVTGGDKQLYVEYMVNYKKEVRPFPAWSPFLDKPADAQGSGVQSVYTQSPTQVKTESGHVAGKPVTIQTDLVMGAPFATLHETGSQRNGVQAWHGYEYAWNAWKVMEPIPGSSAPVSGQQ